MKALWLKRNRIQEAVQLHKAIRVHKRKLMTKLFIRWSGIISTRKEQAIKKKGDRERLLRLCFEAFRIQRTIASPIVPRFQSQFRILNHCMEQWKLFFLSFLAISALKPVSESRIFFDFDRTKP